jgi:hypothetical protein
MRHNFSPEKLQSRSDLLCKNYIIDFWAFVVIPTKAIIPDCVAVEKDVSFRRLTGSGFWGDKIKRR